MLVRLRRAARRFHSQRALLVVMLSSLLIGCSSLAPQDTAEQAQRATTPPGPSLPPEPDPTAPPTSVASATATVAPTPPAATLPLTATAELAEIQPLRSDEIIDRPLRNLRPLTDGTVKYKTAVWSPVGDWIAATPQDGPGLDAINSVTGERITVISDTYVLEPVWDATLPCLLLQRTTGTQDQLSVTCLPQPDAPQPLIADAAPLLAPALAGDDLVVSQAGLLVRHTRSSPAAPQPLVEGSALVTALSRPGPDGTLLAWSPLVQSLSDVQTLVTPLDRPAPRALSQPGEGLWLPRWSPDGRALMLTSVSGRLVSTTISGDARYDLGPGDLPAWSPDSQRIAFGGANAGTEFTSRDIHLVDWQGQGPRLRLTDASEIELFVSPSWSPDGRQIACVEIDSGQIMIGELP